jgi:hypothetical protein
MSLKRSKEGGLERRKLKEKSVGLQRNGSKGKEKREGESGGE